jgi:E3 ubiquitin-protein ligase MARCH6
MAEPRIHQATGGVAANADHSLSFRQYMGSGEFSQTRTNGNDPATADPDTCRICRGEGTLEEPLFYPCKCSGSIKYVHQDCLMEWLSHSQKKHCELCKTPFRFTKLYSPDMPKSLPAHVFVGHMTKYLLRNVMVWLRAALVITVWLCWLPYLMRSVWSFLFWISDEGLGGGQMFRRSGDLGSHSVVNSASVVGPTSCASSPLFAATTTAATVGGLLEQLTNGDPGLLASSPVYNLNVSMNDPPSGTALRAILSTIGLSTANGKNLVTTARNMSLAVNRHPTLLSEVRILKNMTRHSVVNRTLITILEGQLITILVITCFILIILVRDYVVQQQPEINMRAAFAPAENPPPNPMRDIQEAEVEALRGPDEFDEEPIAAIQETAITTNMNAHQLAGQDTSLLHSLESEVEETPHLADLHRRRYSGDHYDGQDTPGITFGPGSSQHSDISSHSIPNPTDGIPESDINHYRDTSRSASHGENNLSSAAEYSRIYRQAGGDPEEVLRIIERENLGDKLDYWVGKTRSMLEKGKSVAGDVDRITEISKEIYGLTYESLESAETDLKLPRATWSWNDSRDASSKQQRTEKGKEKAEDYYSSDNARAHLYAPPKAAFQGYGNPSTTPPHVFRPRATSDGPHRHDSVNPLANNNWSFSALPSESSNPPFDGSSELFPHETGTLSSTSSIYGDEPDHFDVPHSNIPEISSGASVEQDSARSLSQSSLQFVNSRRVSTDFWESETTSNPPASEQPQNLAGSDVSFGMQIAPNAQIDDARRENAQPEDHTFTGWIANFMWGGIDLQPQVPENNPADANGPVENEQNLPPGADAEIRQGNDLDDQDRENADAAEAPGIDPDAVEDAEDFDGIMELIGMRGPLAGLFQNAIFCAVLVSVTIFLCIFLPYNIGRISVWAAAHPMRLVRMLFSLSKFIQDLAVMIAGIFACFVLSLIQLFSRVFGRPSSDTIGVGIFNSWDLAANASTRVLESFTTEIPIISASEMQNFSAISHEALLILKSHVALILSSPWRCIAFTLDNGLYNSLTTIMQVIVNVTYLAWQGLNELPGLLTPNSWVINFTIPEATSTVNPELAYWPGGDRFWAIVAGYITFSCIAALYLRRGTPLSTGQTGQEWEASIVDLLNQASGVMKVILIISIEMLVFPLYCGLLLDLALLPLFENTTLRSRFLFTLNYPLTSIFVHWFIGTAYMFHFALFVSMCRKIMRKGVLCKSMEMNPPKLYLD